MIPVLSRLTTLLQGNRLKGKFTRLDVAADPKTSATGGLGSIGIRFVACGYALRMQSNSDLAPLLAIFQVALACDKLKLTRTGKSNKELHGMEQSV